jgi:hypothetical protein
LQPSVTAKVMAEFVRLTPPNARKAAPPLPEPLSGRELAVLQALTYLPLLEAKNGYFRGS